MWRFLGKQVPHLAAGAAILAGSNYTNIQTFQYHRTSFQQQQPLTRLNSSFSYYTPYTTFAPVLTKVV